jgi:phosphoglycolate phosphatase-like HAD superfamily hydrolase
MNISKYTTLIFDCDGVVLNSNKIKTSAFYNAALPYGIKAAEDLRDYHIKHGGISRYTKFEYFLTDIVKEKVERAKIDLLLSNFASEVKKGLQSCEICSGLKNLRLASKSKWLIVSGGDQNELREVFSSRGLTNFFEGGIFGSPDSKETILSREIKNTNIDFPALFIGDSKYDYHAASNYKIDFVFAYGWTDMTDWNVYCHKNNLNSIQNISYLTNFSSNNEY